jgi:hypothetical protein
MLSPNTTVWPRPTTMFVAWANVGASFQNSLGSAPLSSMSWTR